MAETESAHHAMDRLLADLRRIFGARLRSIGTYGGRDPAAPSFVGDEGVHTVAFVDAVTMADLSACAQASAGWTRSGLAIPLVLPHDELSRSLDAFPLEYEEIRATYTEVFGGNPFLAVHITVEDRRRACEAQAKSHLLHLREGYIESGGRGAAVARLMTDSGAAFRALLANVTRLHGAPAESVDAVIAHADTLGLSRSLISEILAIRAGRGLAAADAARLFPPYLDAVERLARLVDRWHA